MTSGAVREQTLKLREELIAMIPSLEIIVARALGPGDDARDAAQEVLTRALAAIDQDRPIRESLAAFVHGIAAHVIADVRAARARLPVTEVDADQLSVEDAGPLDRMIDDQERGAMDGALARLDPDDRELLRRCYVAGETVAAIAADLGEPASRVRKRKSRALQQLRALLGPGARDGHILADPRTRKT
jgi:RNA polymerase sigma-70 factor (ECF subfamily)